MKGENNALAAILLYGLTYFLLSTCFAWGSVFSGIHYNIESFQKYSLVRYVYFAIVSTVWILNVFREGEYEDELTKTFVFYMLKCTSKTALLICCLSWVTPLYNKIGMNIYLVLIDLLKAVKIYEHFFVVLLLMLGCLLFIRIVSKRFYLLCGCGMEREDH